MTSLGHNELNEFHDKNILQYDLTHWGRVMYKFIDSLPIILSDNGLSPGRRQAIIWNNIVILLNFSELLIEIHKFSFNKMHLNMSSGKWQPCCLGLNVLIARLLVE